MNFLFVNVELILPNLQSYLHSNGNIYYSNGHGDDHPTNHMRDLAKVIHPAKRKFVFIFYNFANLCCNGQIFGGIEYPTMLDRLF